MNNIPTWRMIVFAIATFGGLYASILLFIKKKKSFIFFIVSLLGIILGNIYDVFIANYYRDTDFSGLIMPILIFLLGVFFIWYAKKSEINGLLN